MNFVLYLHLFDIFLFSFPSILCFVIINTYKWDINSFIFRESYAHIVLQGQRNHWSIEPRDGEPHSAHGLLLSQHIAIDERMAKYRTLPEAILDVAGGLFAEYISK